MATRNITILPTIFLVLVVIILTISSIATFHKSDGFIFLLGLLFLFSLANAFLKTSIRHRKDSQYPKLFKNFFARVRSPVRAEVNSEEFVDPPKYESHKPQENDYVEKQESTFILLSEYLSRNNYHLTDEILEAIEWKRFELLCHLIFKAMGYNSELTGNGADKGVDIRIFDKNIPGKTLFLVQCKKRKSNISRENIQQLRGQMSSENVEKGGYCVTSDFTVPAMEYAAANTIELFGRRKIIESFNNLGIYERQLALGKILDGDYWTPSCASCGDKFELIVQKSGRKIWGCKKIKQHGWSQIHYYDASPIRHVK